MEITIKKDHMPLLFDIIAREIKVELNKVESITFTEESPTITFNIPIHKDMVELAMLKESNIKNVK